MNKNWKAATLAVQGGYEAKDGEPRVAPIVQSTTYRYDTTQSVADLFDLKREGFFYSRLANPTVDVMEKKIAALEGGVAAVALSSGQTANTLAILNIAKSGDHVVASAALYGGTVNLFAVTLPKMGINVTMVDADASEAEIVAAVRPNTRAIFAETIANPALTVIDFEKFAGEAVDIKLYKPDADGKKSYTAVLLSHTAETLELEVNGGARSVARTAIAQCRVHFDF